MKGAPKAYLSRRLSATSPEGTGKKAQERLQQLNIDKIPNVFGGTERIFPQLEKSLRELGDHRKA